MLNQKAPQETDRADAGLPVRGARQATKHRRARLGDDILRWALLPLLPVAVVVNRSRARLDDASTDRLIRRRQQELLGHRASH